MQDNMVDILVYSYYIIIQDNMVTFLFILTILLYNDNIGTILCILTILWYKTTWWHFCLFLQYNYTRQHGDILVYSYYIIKQGNMVTFLFILTMDYYTRQHGGILVYSFYIIIQDNMVKFLFILAILLYKTTWWHSCLFLLY